MKPLIFWDHVDKTATCWLWTASTRRNYGQARLPGRTQQNAHRVAWILTHGEIADGMVVRHKCDNPLCVRPEHLEVGTHKDNSQDMARRGRHVGNRKLNEQQEDEILQRLAVGERQTDIAVDYGICQATVSKLKRRRTKP